MRTVGTVGEEGGGTRCGIEWDGASDGVTPDYDYAFLTFQMKSSIALDVGSYLFVEPGKPAVNQIADTNNSLSQAAHSDTEVSQPDRAVGYPDMPEASNVRWGSPDEIGMYNHVEAWICSSGP